LNMLSNEIFIEYVQVGIFRSIDSNISDICLIYDN